MCLFHNKIYPWKYWISAFSNEVVATGILFPFGQVMSKENRITIVLSSNLHFSLHMYFYIEKKSPETLDKCISTLFPFGQVIYVKFMDY